MHAVQSQREGEGSRAHACCLVIPTTLVLWLYLCTSAAVRHKTRRHVFSPSFDLGAKIYGSELGAKICGSDLEAKTYGSEIPITLASRRMPCCRWLGTSEPRSMALRRVISEPQVLAPTPRSKDEFTSPKGPSVHFFQK
jgi:hypothetical protein